MRARFVKGSVAKTPIGVPVHMNYAFRPEEQRRAGCFGDRGRMSGLSGQRLCDEGWEGQPAPPPIVQLHSCSYLHPSSIKRVVAACATIPEIDQTHSANR